ncbi:unnamed protein product, partial [marine sediment metagenome]
KGKRDECSDFLPQTSAEEDQTPGEIPLPLVRQVDPF